MKATGIVRRIDDLGRVVIPKEIRRTLRIREGEQLEIFTGKDSEIILKKYSPLGEFGKTADELCASFSEVINKIVCIVDKDEIVASSIDKDEKLKGKNITKELEKIINNRVLTKAKRGEVGYIQISESIDKNDFEYQLIKPIVLGGDSIGAVILLSEKDRINKEDENNANIISLFYEKQLYN